MQITLPRDKIRSLGSVADSLAAVSGFLYLIQSWRFIHEQRSLLDEGAYLVSGYLFASRRYWPFQDFGPWTNQMPLSFLFPGIVQVIFGPGLRTGRYFALVLGCLLIIGLWIVARRLGGKWIAAGVLLAVAANPAIIKIYSLAISQVLIACLLIWVLVLVIGGDRPTWQIFLGSTLAGLLPLTRLNMLPVLPLIFLYVYRQCGRRTGLLATLLGSGVFAIGHIFFWPGILRMWAEWIPTAMAPFLGPWRAPQGIPLWNPEIKWQSRALSFLLGIRFHFIAFTSLFTSLLLWPEKRSWKSESQFHTSSILAVMFLILLLAHAWASLGINPQTYDALGRNYCAFCYPVYTAFYANLGLLLLAASMSGWEREVISWRNYLVVFVILILAVAVGFSAYDPLGDIWLKWRVPRILTFLRTGKILPGIVPLKLYIQRWGIDYALARRLFPAVAGLIAGVLILGIAGLIILVRMKRKSLSNSSYGYTALAAFLMTGLVLSPTAALGGGLREYDCRSDVLDA